MKHIIEKTFSNPYLPRTEFVKELNPQQGETLAIIREAFERGYGGSYLCLLALRRANTVILANQIQTKDLDWFLPAAILMVEQMEEQALEILEKDRRNLLMVIPRKAKKEAIRRLKEGAYDRKFLAPSHKEGASTILLLLLEGRLEEARQPLPAKVVGWEVVRNIANNLTNQLYLGEGVKIKEAHISSGWSQGPGREWKLEPSHTGCYRPASKNAGWLAFQEEDVRQLSWWSMTSECQLRADKISHNQWELTFIPSPKFPLYRGSYYGMYEEPHLIENVDPSYVYQT